MRLGESGVDLRNCALRDIIPVDGANGVDSDASSFVGLLA